ncbi:Protein of unknown function [Pyronema omphalodes CBS 100304]|uniref:Uncharacterized protein n=1 Tax=Pyronema omphalodes (strain CBS 100304) TaxID=1076935 RepID=U4LWX4_PYROM|nr:Protein of unknown function [Pyronema omphalodes CBS 100304]
MMNSDNVPDVRCRLVIKWRSRYCALPTVR